MPLVEWEMEPLPACSYHSCSRRDHHQQNLRADKISIYGYLIKSKTMGRLSSPLLCLGLCLCAALAEVPCDSKYGTDLSDGVVLKNGTIVHLGLSYTPGDYVVDSNGTKIGCTCRLKPCLRKCCPLGQFLTNKTCVPTTKGFVIPEARGAYSPEWYHIVSGSECGPRKRRLLLDPRYNNSNDDFQVLWDGRLFLAAGQLRYDQMDYCVDYIEEEDEIQALICTDRGENDLSSQYAYYSIGMIISMPFLLATFFVYAVLPDRNLHGKSLMCYVISLFGAYFILVFIQLYPDDFSDFNCKTLGILCLFFFMVSFYWMNVMSIDIWWAFSGLRGFSGSKKEAERKRFILYSIYAWGMPLLHVVIVSSLTLSNCLPRNAWYNPSIGDGQCWFREGEPTLLYFYGPMALIILGNITLFCITAWKIKQVKQDTAMLRKDESKKHSYENDKQRFNLYLKLMLAMGVNWAMEIISWTVNWRVGHVPPGVWYLTDFCNALYGVVIFFIFVFKRNIWKLLKRRYYILLGKPHLARSMTQTAYSPRTTGSTLSQTVTTEKSFVNDSSILTSEVA